MTLNIKDQIRELIKAEPGISSLEIREFFKGEVKLEIVSTHLSEVYYAGDHRRETIPGRGPGKPMTFRYWYEPGFVPEPSVRKRKLKGPTQTALDFQVGELKARVAELEAFRADAIRRYPDLLIPAVILKARRIIADEFHDDPVKARQIMAGDYDEKPIIRGVVKALEMTGDD